MSKFENVEIQSANFTTLLHNSVFKIPNPYIDAIFTT